QLLQNVNNLSYPVHSLLNVSPLYNKDKLRALINERGNPFINFSGVFGLFRAQKEAIIKDLKSLITNFENHEFDNLDIEKYRTSHYTLNETDPSQEAVLKGIDNKNKIVIHGPPGTGKSQTLTAIIINALANYAKVIVVCEKRTALEVIKTNLAEKGLSDYCCIVEDVHRDRKAIIESVRNRDLECNPISRDTFISLEAEAQLYSKEINIGHKFFDKKLLNEHNWTSLIGKFLNLKKKSSNYENIYSDLNTNGFDFKSSEVSSLFNSSYQKLFQNQSLFKPIVKKYKQFSFLDDSNLKNSFNDIDRSELQKRLSSIVTSLEAEITVGEKVRLEYSETLKAHFEDYYNELKEYKEELKVLYSEISKL